MGDHSRVKFAHLTEKADADEQVLVSKRDAEVLSEHECSCGQILFHQRYFGLDDFLYDAINDPGRIIESCQFNVHSVLVEEVQNTDHLGLLQHFLRNLGAWLLNAVADEVKNHVEHLHVSAPVRGEALEESVELFEDAALVLVEACRQIEAQTSLLWRAGVPWSNNLAEVTLEDELHLFSFGMAREDSEDPESLHLQVVELVLCVVEVKNLLDEDHN